MRTMISDVTSAYIYIYIYAEIYIAPAHWPPGFNKYLLLDICKGYPHFEIAYGNIFYRGPEAKVPTIN